MSPEHYDREFRNQLYDELQRIRDRLYELQREEALLRLSEAAILECLRPQE